jgi:iron complex transport system permease protein
LCRTVDDCGNEISFHSASKTAMNRCALIALLSALFLLAFTANMMSGKVWIGFDLWLADDPRGWIISQLRLPRAILAATIGATLGLCGAVLQGYLRNPLADPGLLGISSGAALGAVTSIYFGLSAAIWIMPTFGMGGAALTMAVLLFLVGRSGSVVTFVLAGVILSSFTGALTALLISLAPNPFAVSEIINWLMGALTDRSMDDVKIALPFMALGAIILFSVGRALDALSLGEDTAKSLGFNLSKLQWMIVTGCGLAVGASVAITGVIGFVGLIVPHVMRPLVRAQPSALLLPSALAGSVLLLITDAAVRMVPGAAELKLGIAMALLGTPFFLGLLLHWRRQLP